MYKAALACPSRGGAPVPLAGWQLGIGAAAPRPLGSISNYPDMPNTYKKTLNLILQGPDMVNEGRSRRAGAMGAAKKAGRKG